MLRDINLKMSQNIAHAVAIKKLHFLDSYDNYAMKLLVVKEGGFQVVFAELVIICNNFSKLEQLDPPKCRH